MKSRLRFVVVAIVIVTVSCAAQVSWSQAPTSRYQPNRSTVSPYLNLLRRENGGLPNYYAFVRPAQQQRQQADQSQFALRQQRRTLGRVERDILRITSPPTGTASGFMIVGNRGGFQIYSHYFPQTRRSRRQR